MNFAEQILARLDELGLNVNQAEAQAGFPQGYIRGVVRDDVKRATPSIDKAEAIARSLGMEFYLGPIRDGASGPPSADMSEFVQVPRIDASLSAGLGFDNHTEAIVGSMAFRREWLKRIGVPPAAAVLATVSGESMMPTISPGDLLLIDTSDKRPISRTNRKVAFDRKFKRPIYAFVDDDGARVKRVIGDGEGGFLFSSDNHEYPPQRISRDKADTLSIIGRVAWWGHTDT